jgi:beta-N-acetylhexosaminidase
MRDASNHRLTRRGAVAAGAACGLTLLRQHAIYAQAAAVETLVASLTSRERAARMFMLPVTGTSLSAEDDAQLRDLKPGGVILDFDNIGAVDEVRALVTAIHATNPALPPLVAVDQEGGFVIRIGDDPAPDAPTLGSLPAAQIAALARARAEMLAGYGFDVNFAPVADVAFTPDSIMAGRAFGDDPPVVAADVAAYLQGVAGTGVIHCVKHFPGHGRVAVDSHEALPILDVDPALWWQADALPFRAAVDAGVPMVMLGHLVLPAWGDLPASISPEAARVLRQDLGFTGAIVTDDLGMGALSQWSAVDVVDLALDAGADLLLFVVLAQEPATLVDHLVARMESDAAVADRVAASVTRLVRMQLDRTTDV